MDQLPIAKGRFCTKRQHGRPGKHSVNTRPKRVNTHPKRVNTPLQIGKHPGKRTRSQIVPSKRRVFELFGVVFDPDLAGVGVLALRYALRKPVIRTYFGHEYDRIVAERLSKYLLGA